MEWERLVYFRLFRPERHPKTKRNYVFDKAVKKTDFWNNDKY